MIFRAAIFLSSIASTGVVVAFAPHTPASVAVSHLASARPPFVPSWKLAAEADTSASEAATVEESISDGDEEDTAALSEGDKKQYDFALLFDCDGVILETEELHRLAYNAAFREFEVTRVCGDVSEPVEWSVGYYDILQNSIGGGKPKMRHYFSQLIRFESNEHGDPTLITATISKKLNRKERRKQKKNPNGQERIPVTISSSDIQTGLESLIDAIQTRKTELYKSTVEENAVARPGLLDLMDEALADDSIAVGVCSASTKAAAQKVLECTLGPDRVNKLDVCILGDDVSEKKPSPLIYNTARERLGIDSPKRCVVVEDSAVGLRAAKAAEMRCLITYTESTTNEDFYAMGADAKVPDLANNSNRVTLNAIFDPLRKAFASSSEDFTVIPELLVGLKDDPAVEEEDEELYDEDDNLILVPIEEEDVAANNDISLSTEAATKEDVAEEAEPVVEEPIVTVEDVTEEVTAEEAEPVDEEPIVADEDVTEDVTAEEAEPVDEEPIVADEDVTGDVTAEEAEPVDEEPIVADEDVTEDVAAEEAEPAEEDPDVEEEEISAEEADPADENPAVEVEDVTEEDEAQESVSVEDEPIVLENVETNEVTAEEAEPADEEPVVAEESSPEEPVVEEPTVEESPEKPSEAATPTPSRRIIRAKMTQDDMGNFSM